VFGATAANAEQPLKAATAGTWKVPAGNRVLLLAEGAFQMKGFLTWTYIFDDPLSLQPLLLAGLSTRSVGAPPTRITENPQVLQPLGLCRAGT
jgi:hypothetical protein